MTDRQGAVVCKFNSIRADYLEEYVFNRIKMRWLINQLVVWKVNQHKKKMVKSFYIWKNNNELEKKQLDDLKLVFKNKLIIKKYMGIFRILEPYLKIKTWIDLKTELTKLKKVE